MLTRPDNGRLAAPVLSGLCCLEKLRPLRGCALHALPLDLVLNSQDLHTMEQQRPQEFILEAFADPGSVRDVVRGTYAINLPSAPHLMKEQGFHEALKDVGVIRMD